jgi:cation diffusion facilitator CzcD-associated flavoprotein CzcO
LTRDRRRFMLQRRAGRENDTDLPMQSPEHFNVAIVGAGISGVDAAYHLQTALPKKTYAILEARDAIGGTWDLFRYPGIRSDSDMHTLGFPFRPWQADEAIAGGPAIWNYIRETAAHYGIDRHIRLGHRMIRASWSSADARWTVEAQTKDGRLARLVCRFLYMCSGYYSYENGFRPEFPGMNRFHGQFVHPQEWPESLDYAGKRIVVIGSGATAVTLVPALAKNAAHVTMLQRSPSYVVTLPSKDAKAIWMFRHLPKKLAAKLTKWKNVLYSITMFHLARTKPAMLKGLILKGIKQQLPPDYDVERHFTPRYNPWDQRICLVPDGDLFAAIRSGRAEVVTDTIAEVEESGIRLSSGATLPADIIVSATGLVVKLMGGAEILVDGVRAKLSEKLVYKGAMFSGVPNLALAFGYTNNSWTLRCDLTARFVCRLLKYMDRKGFSVCMPNLPDSSVNPEPLLDFSSGYVRRADGVLPKQGQRAPWRVPQNYVKDLAAFTFGSVNDGTMSFLRTPEADNVSRVSDVHSRATI